MKGELRMKNMEYMTMIDCLNPDLPVLRIKCRLNSIGICIIKIRRPHHPLIFITGNDMEMTLYRDGAERLVIQSLYMYELHAIY